MTNTTLSRGASTTTTERTCASVTVKLKNNPAQNQYNGARSRIPWPIKTSATTTNGTTKRRSVLKKEKKPLTGSCTGT
ncbi:MAG: hypothetical protein DMF69_00025 [Acidobacteria bacterium]|nr:MAG: hypothetical protein DMF69_00025 [Acidobacteriota bacterium]